MTNSNLIDETACEIAIAGIIEQQTKPLKRKPGKNSVILMAIDKKRESLDMIKLCTADDTSELNELFKTL